MQRGAGTPLIREAGRVVIARFNVYRFFIQAGFDSPASLQSKPRGACVNLIFG